MKYMMNIVGPRSVFARAACRAAGRDSEPRTPPHHHHE